MWTAFLAKDAAGVKAAFHPEVEWDGTNLPDGRIAHGYEAATELYVVKDGKIVYRKGFSDADEALADTRR